MQFLHRFTSSHTRVLSPALSAVVLMTAASWSTSAIAQLVPGGGIIPPARELQTRDPQTGEDAVKISTAVVGEAKPGATIRVAVTFEIHPGWHIYWENPGESGSPTDLAIELPAGCSMPQRDSGKPRIDFPRPQIFSHGETTFGYEKRVTLSFPVTFAADFPQDTLQSALAAKLSARWLVCKERCLMGAFQGTIDLAKPAAPDSAAAKALAEALAEVPKPLPSDWKVSLEEVTEDSALLVIEAPATSASSASPASSKAPSTPANAPLKFIPFDTPGAVLAEGYLAESKLGRLEVEIDLSRESALGKSLEVGGIVILGNERAAYAFRIPVAAAAK